MTDYDIKKIRNFSIIAHIDHGKSTIADRLIQLTGGIEERNMKNQVLDNMEIERERGITIKAQTVRLNYIANDNEKYILNLIDTPGHVDFSYEVNRSLAACEGSILIVDVSQGVEAQTLANVYKAIEHNHEIIIVLNKIDLPSADSERIKLQIEDIIGIDTSQSIKTSAKTGFGIKNVLEAIVKQLPYPKGNIKTSLKAALIDSWYDQYLGVVVLVRIINGIMKKGQYIKMISANTSHLVDRLGIFNPNQKIFSELRPGEIGFFTANIKEVADTHVGDTITDLKNPCTKIIKGYHPSQPVVFCGLFPVDSNDFKQLRKAIIKLRLNDASFKFETESSIALGFGFRCGFLGLLHMEIICDRLKREFNIKLIVTAPSVTYRMYMINKSIKVLNNPSDMPNITNIKYIQEPWIEATIIVPNKYLGSILKLCQDRRGIQKKITFVSSRAIVIYELPLNEVIIDFYDRLKSYSRGYGSFNYDLIDYRKGELVRMYILVNGETVDALTMIIHHIGSKNRGRIICQKLKEIIPRHLFKVPIQAVVNGRVIARETINAMRKDVTAKCYGGDVSRKRKLLDKQKKGKKKMRQFGRIEIPQEAFINALKIDN